MNPRYVVLLLCLAVWVVGCADDDTAVVPSATGATVSQNTPDWTSTNVRVDGRDYFCLVYRELGQDVSGVACDFGSLRDHPEHFAPTTLPEPR